MAVNASSSVAPPVSPPWSQIVVSAAPHSSPSPPPSTVVVDTPSVTSAVDDIDNNSGANNANIGKRIVWNKPSNAASSSVMDAESWPALSDAAKAPAKSPPLPPQQLVETSLGASTLPQLQGTGSMLPFPHDRVRGTASMNNTAPMPTQQRPYRRMNPNMSSNGGQPQQFSVPQGSIAVPPGSHSHSSAPNNYPPRPGFVPNDQPHHRNSFKYRNSGQHQRGDGFHHQNYGSRRDQVRGNQDWNAHQRNFNARENYRSPRFVQPFVRPPLPANTAQYYAPPPPPPPPSVWPFVGSYGYHELPPQMVYNPSLPMEQPIRGVPYVQSVPPNAIFYQPIDPLLYTKIVNQIDYYFSDQNLCNDIYLKKLMDDQGWVPLNIIAGFKLVKHLTDNIQIVFDAVRTSSVVETQGGKIRRRNGWWKWITPPTQSQNVAGSEAVGELAKIVQSIDLETNKNHTTQGDSIRKYMITTSESTGQVGIQESKK